MPSLNSRLPWQRFGFWTWIDLLQKRRRNHARGCRALKAEFCGMNLCPACEPQIQDAMRRAKETD